MLANEAGDPAKLCPIESSAASEPHGVEPELGNALVPLDVDMRRFVTIARIEEEPVWPNPESSRHRLV
jgi:hypothetical protein